MQQAIFYMLAATFVLIGGATFGMSVTYTNIRSKGTTDGTTTHSNVVCILQRDAGSQLSARVVLTGTLATGWARVEVAKDGLLLYSGSIEGANYDKPSKRKVFEFLVHEDAAKNSKIIINSFYDAVLTLPLSGVRITAKPATINPPTLTNAAPPHR